jgi:prepilin-type N-terminal cleavage/methylation domain-containing protein
MTKLRAFTLVEVLVVLAIVAALMALLLPALGQSKVAARRLQSQAIVRTCGQLISLYARDFADAYPLSDPFMQSASYDWDKALLAGGYIKSKAELDPIAGRFAHPFVSFKLSMCVVADPSKFVLGNTSQVDLVPSRLVRQHEVRYPAHKGIVLEQFANYSSPNQDSMYCCVPLVPAPVLFADESVVVGTWKDFAYGQSTLRIVDWIGEPVFSTWGGYEARDR